MVIRPPHLNAYEFVVVSALRTQQLLAGCTPSVAGEHSAATLAQMEVAGGHVARSDQQSLPPRQCGWQL
jgi:DNA-directed RNA polymerase subunit K/omega